MTTESVRTRIVAYLPAFVQAEADPGTAILAAISTALAALWTAISDLPTMDTTGLALRMEADEWRLMRSGQESEATLQAALADRFAILSRRGTAAQALIDVRRVSADATATTTFYTQDETGWWLDATYPGVSPTCFLDAGPIVDITMQNKSALTTERLKSIIRHEIIPLKGTIIYS